MASGLWATTDRGQLVRYLDGCRQLIAAGDCTLVWVHIATNRRKHAHKWERFLSDETGVRFRIWGGGDTWDVSGYLEE